MTWGECKLIALQTMFANEGAALNVDDINQDYLYAMPGKANEALHQLATVGRPILKQFRIIIESEAEETVTADALTLPAIDGRYKLILVDYCPRFRAMEQLLLDSGGIYGQADDWDMEGDNVLVLPGDMTGTYTMWYAAYPQVISAETADEEKLDLPEEAAVLIPLYIAGALYKEDELAMATMFRNEFEDGLAKLQQSYMASGGGVRGGYRRNMTGWW